MYELPFLKEWGFLSTCCTVPPAAALQETQASLDMIRLLATITPTAREGQRVSSFPNHSGEFLDSLTLPFVEGAMHLHVYHNNTWCKTYKTLH